MMTVWLVCGFLKIFLSSFGVSACDNFNHVVSNLRRDSSLNAHHVVYDTRDRMKLDVSKSSCRNFLVVLSRVNNT